MSFFATATLIHMQKDAESMQERTDGLERADSRAEFRSERANLRHDGA